MYSIKILNNRDFDALYPKYKGAKEALGLADPKINTAFIRDTGMEGVNLLTIHHELDELLAKVSPDEEDGIRYKKFKQFLPSILGILTAPLLGPAAGPLVTALTAGGVATGTRAIQGAVAGERALGVSALKAGILPAVGGYAMAPGVTAAGAEGAGYLGRLGAGLKGAVGMAPTAPTTVAPGATALGQVGKAFPMLTSIPGGAGQTFAGIGAATLPIGALTTGVPTALTAPTTAYNPNLPTAISDLPTAEAPPTGLWGQAKTALGKVLPTVLEKGLGRLAETAADLANPMTQMGLGMMSASALPTAPTPPEIGPIASKWLTPSTITKAGKMAETIAEIEYLGPFQPSKEISAFIEVQGKDIDKQYDLRLTQMDQRMATINPHWQTSGERFEMIRRINEERTDTKTKMRADWMMTAKKEHGQRQYDYVMNRLAIDEATKRDFLFADINDVMLKYAVEYKDIMDFRQIAADAGLYLLAKGTGLA